MPEWFDTAWCPEFKTGPAEHPELPLRWRKPRYVAVCPDTDLFTGQDPIWRLGVLFGVMLQAERHTFCLDTAHTYRLREAIRHNQHAQVQLEDMAHNTHNNFPSTRANADTATWPLPNLYIGARVCDQRTLDARVGHLLRTPAAGRYLLIDPMTGPVDLSGWVDRWRDDDPECCQWMHRSECDAPAVAVRNAYNTTRDASMVPVCAAHRGIDWVIVAGERGPKASPTHPDWVRKIASHCKAIGVPFFFDGWGEWVPDEWVDADGYRHHGAKPVAKDPRTLVMHLSGMTALTPDNPFDPYKAGHPGWHTVMRRLGARRSGRVLDGRTYDERPRRSS